MEILAQRYKGGDLRAALGPRWIFDKRISKLVLRRV